MDQYLTSEPDRQQQLWLLSRRGHTWTVVSLLVLVAGFSMPIWASLRGEIADRLPDTAPGAITIGAAVSWTAVTIGNLATVGVLMAVMGTLGAGLARWIGGTRDFARARRAFALGWAGFVALRAGGWLLVGLLSARPVASAVPSVTRADAGVLLMLPLSVVIAWRLCELPLRKALFVGGALGGVFAAACFLLAAF
ncbi:hypothetical protein [Kitasatospora sp. NPDC089509]|uniref:hypothetical protein n=1 Tax=Kitasatospora sp. NPDC089509 TaxID=3364079 RepID=UPI0038204501